MYPILAGRFFTTVPPGKTVNIQLEIYSLSDSFPLQVITIYWVQFPVLFPVVLFYNVFYKLAKAICNVIVMPRACLSWDFQETEALGHITWDVHLLTFLALILCNLASRGPIHRRSNTISLAILCNKLGTLACSYFWHFEIYCELFDGTFFFNHWLFVWTNLMLD